MYNNNELEKIEFVRNSLLINHFCKIASLCENHCPIIPLKGISLLFSLYKDYSRNVGDIDLLVYEKDIEKIIELLGTIGYILRTPEMNRVRLQTKGKFDMIHSDKKYCDLDIHIDLINKKWFKLSTGDFTSFALNRIKTIEYKNMNINILSETDEWLYLALHYCFHLFSNDKWLKDLYLIQKKFSDTDIIELIATTHRFHFERIVTAGCRCLKNNYPQDEIKIPEMLTKKYPVFDSICSKNLKFAYKFSNRIIAIYWEFIFIHSCKSRVNAYLHFLFPKLHIVMDIYNYKPIISLLLYPIHVALVLLSSILFIPVLMLKIK